MFVIYHVEDTWTVNKQTYLLNGMEQTKVTSKDGKFAVHFRGSESFSVNRIALFLKKPDQKPGRGLPRLMDTIK